MNRAATKGKRHLGLTMDDYLLVRLKDLAKNNGVSVAFLVQRAVAHMIDTNIIPWPGSSDTTAQREAEKDELPREHRLAEPRPEKPLRA